MSVSPITAAAPSGRVLGLRGGEVAYRAGAGGQSAMLDKHGGTWTVSKVAPARVVTRTRQMMTGREGRVSQVTDTFAVYNSRADAFKVTGTWKPKSRALGGNALGLAAVAGAVTFGAASILAAPAAGAAATAASAAASSAPAAAGINLGAPAFTAAQTASFNASLAAGTVGSTAAVGSIAGTTGTLAQADAAIKAADVLGAIKASSATARDTLGTAAALKSAFAGGGGSVEAARAGSGEFASMFYPSDSAGLLPVTDSAPELGAPSGGGLGTGAVLALLAGLLILKVAA